jgi:hypothetical protein
MTDEPEQDPDPEPQQDPTPEPDPTVELPGEPSPTIKAPGDEPAGETEMESLAAFSYPGEKTVNSMRKELHLDDLKDAGEWVWDKLNSKPKKAPEPIPIVIDLPPSEEETTMRSSSVAHEDPPPPPPPEENKPPARTGR